jgi:hypothetical protein
MFYRERVCIQRAMCREAIGKLKAVLEYFGSEEGYVAGANIEATKNFEEFYERVHALEHWIFHESALS